MFGDTNYVTQLESQKDQLRSQDFEPLEIQLWHYVPGMKLKLKQNLRKMYKQMPSFQRDLPHNYFSTNLIFEECLTKKMGLILDEYLDSNEYQIVNKEIEDADAQDEKGKLKLNQMTMNEFKQKLVAGGQDQQIIDIDVKFIEKKPENTDKKDEKDSKKKGDPKEEQDYAHKPFFPILNKLEHDGGIIDLINVAIAVVKSYQSKKPSDTWSLWLEEVKSFIELPNFFTYFSQDYQKSQTIYKLIGRAYDIDKNEKKEQVEVLNKKYEKMYTEHVNYIYKIINEVFSKHTDSALREKCIQNGTYSKFLDRLGQLTGEKTRKKIDLDQLIIPEKDEDNADSQSAKSNSAQKSKETGSKKKKGVGYAGGNSTWNVAEYLQSKEAKNEQIQMILSIIMQSIKQKPQEEQEDSNQIDSGSQKIDMKDIILESPLLPILEGAIRSGSLLDMAKQSQLYNVYLDLIVEMASNKKYISLLDKISKQYVPEQKNSIQNLLEKIAGQSQIFINALSGKNQVSSSGKESEDDKKSKALAERILKTEEIVKSKMKETLRKEHSLKLQSLASLPLNHAYTELLAPLRFAYMSMKKSIGDKNYDHIHNTDVQNNPNPSQSKIIRLAQEIADLSNSLPCEPSNAMFCRVEKGRVDLMKVMIMGAAGTPYAHGAFVYDLFFPDTYPNNAPKCLLVTTGGGQVRFNPNLYNQGKVCLSLLGTWGGSNTETWDPKLSTILQLVMSIQAIIMSNEVYFNEPGYEHEMSTTAGEKKNTGYSNIVKYCNVKFAIIEAIKSPPKGFEKVIRRNYYLKKQMILDEVKEWCIQAKDEASANYTGLVSSHNNSWATKLSQPGAYKKMMDEVYKELEKTLNSIKNPFNEDEDDVEENMKKAVEKVKEESESKKLDGMLKVQGENLDDIDMSYSKIKESKKDDQKIDIDDDKVKDRWSRYIGAMGIEAVAKQAESRVLICDMGALSVEIAKNIVLAGCKELVIFEKISPQGLTITANIASGQFFLSDQDKEQSLALQCKHKLQELNHYVKVTVIKDKKYATVVDYLKAQKVEKAQPFRAVVHTDFFTQDQQHLIQEVIESNKFCRQENIPFIWAYVAGCMARIFTDFGAKFKVLETSSEEIPDVMIKSIDKQEAKEGDKDGKKKVLVTLIDGVVHQFQDGDLLKFEEVNGMKFIKEQNNKDDQIDSSAVKLDQKDSINGQELKVSNVINKSKFEIELDMDTYTKYEGSGIAKYQKTPKIIEFKSLEEYLNTYKQFIKEYKEKGKANLEKIVELQGKAGFFDDNMLWADFEKLQEIQLTDLFITGQIDARPKDEDDEDVQQDKEAHAVENIYFDLIRAEKDEKAKLKMANTIFKILYMHNEFLNVNLAPLCAFLGGVIGQEIVKAMTQKFMPIKQLAYVSCSELIDSPFTSSKDFELKTLDEEIQNRINIVENDDTVEEKQKCQIRLLGQSLHDRISNCKLFMIGAGAIGCELLKNYAMLGVGTGKNGHIILTDPDVIEVSNLNRQFLFREQHLRKPKSSTAAAAAIQMNKQLKGHIIARLDKIHDETADIYSEEFYENQTIITNALDNVKARLYIDGKCVQARVPMIDSGTLGPKGHVQVVIPFKTESYASQKDPEQTNEIPYCTLKMFPEETLHCVEWAKDLFDNWFTLDSQSFNKFLIADLDQQDFGNSQTQEIAKKFIKLDQKRPKNFKDCIQRARKQFQILYNYDILQLLHTYPLDKKNPDGRPFWSLPKRPPKNIEFDKSNEVHCTFIGAYSCLLAGVYKIDFLNEKEFLDDAKNPRSKESRKKMAEYASTLEVKPFKPNDEKAKQIQAEVDKASGKIEEEDDKEKPQQSSLAEDDQKEIEEIQSKIQEIRKRLFGDQKDQVDQKTSEKAQLKVEEFEKDEDENFHIDIIFAMANIRAANYSLQFMDWITVKIKAGRIVPALATTTAAIAGLQTIEMLKIIKGVKLDEQKNSFLNLAVPSMMMGEPGAPEKFKLTDDLSVNLWDRWEYEKATPKTTLLDVIKHIDKIHKSKLEFRDVFQGAKPLFIYSLGQTNMKIKKLSKIEESSELNKSILELTGTSPKEMEIQKFMDLTITFSIKKSEKEKDEGSEYEILKNVPDVRVYFIEEKTSSAAPAQEQEEVMGQLAQDLFGGDDDY